MQEDNQIVQLDQQQILHRILNENNKPITEEFINQIFERVGFKHRVQNMENFQQAMIHESYLESQTTNPKTTRLLKDVVPIDPKDIPQTMPLQKHSYERLEFLGDSVIRHGIGKYLFMRYPEEDEGFLTSNRSKMENKFALSKLARRLCIQQYAVIARSIEQVGGRSGYVNITEDVFEAFVGALNLEVGDDRSIEFIWKIIELELDLAETIRTQKNYKDMLMQYFHKIDVVRRDLLYEDYEIEVNGKKKYRTVVREKETREQLGCGSGKSKKSSQQHAAKDAMSRLGLLEKINKDEYFDIDPEVNINHELNKTGNELCRISPDECEEYLEYNDQDILATQNEIKKIKKTPSAKPKKTKKIDSIKN